MNARDRILVGLLLIVAHQGASWGDDLSAPALLQVFEARWDTIEDRMVDIFVAGYGGMWLPPPGRADSGGLSAGYDVFDRFDLGKPRNETLYGTETSFKALVKGAHTAGLNVYTDMILNHNGFRDSSTPGFIAAGDYPGFVTTLPGEIDGDFHGRFEAGDENFRLAGLIDIAQERNNVFIRHPIGSDPANIPAGTFHDRPDPQNATLYPDRDPGGTVVFDPRTGQNVTLYDFNTSDPLQGDAVAENATGLLLRHLRWMVQEMGVDGFRYDAARHFPRWVLDLADQAVFLAKKEPLLDGSTQHVFSFSETGYGSPGFLQDFIRKDIDPTELTRVGGNRDALDFNLSGAMRANLSSNGFANDWRNVKNASIDANDDFLANNGSQGVAFASSHDEFGAYLENVAHAYILMRPGNALVYFNAKEFGPNRDFPKDGRGDALGGLYGDAITTLVNLRNSHGRGDYRDRTPGGDEKEMLIYEREKSALVVLSNRLDGGFDSRTVQTSFQPGTPLIELTGNAEDPVIDPLDDFPSLLIVQNDGTVNLRVPRNVAPGAGGTEHKSGYLVYGVAGPEGVLRLTDRTGADLANVLPGDTPSATSNGTTRLNDLTVVSGDQFKVRLETNPVNLLGFQRDRHADGDEALLRVDGGVDVNTSAGVDNVDPSVSVTYGFEAFEDVHQPGFFDPDGVGLYEQSIDATRLSEGVHFVTARAFRHRNPQTFTDDDPTLAGDGGPAVYTDFRRAIYVDRLPPEAEIISFAPFESDPDNLANRDLVAGSVDQTADNMHIFLNLPANVSDADVLAMAFAGQNDAGDYDRDQWIYGFFGVNSGNNVATVVTFEPTGRSNVQRFPGLLVSTGLGAGLGDVNFDNTIDADDLGPGADSFEELLYSQNGQFNPAADVSGDGLIDNRDLFALEVVLEDAGVDASTMAAFRDIVVRRGDLDQNGSTDAADIDFLFASFGNSTWLTDLNVDGVTDTSDVEVIVFDILGTLFGDANLDGAVDASDFNHWNSNKFRTGTGWASGDFNGDGTTDASDFNIWNENKFIAGNGGVGTVPEPGTGMMLPMWALCAWAAVRSCPPRALRLCVMTSADQFSRTGAGPAEE